MYSIINQSKTAQSVAFCPAGQKLYFPVLRRAWLWAVMFGALPILFLAGCRGDIGGVITEKEEKQYRRGQSLMREGRNQEALLAFFKVIEKRWDAPESHLEAGRIYLDHIKDPIAAIYHFRKFLEFNPKSPQAPLVEQLIDTAKKEFARRLAGNPFAADINRLDLLELLDQANADSLELKKQLAMANAKLARARNNLASARAQPAPEPEPIRIVVTSQPPVAVSEAPSEALPRPTEYIVEPGDTLTRISAKLYNTSSRYMDIYQANRDILRSPHDVRVGQKLRIP